MASIFITAHDSELISSLESLFRHTKFETSFFVQAEDMVKDLNREIPSSIIAQAKFSKLETANMVKKIKNSLPSTPIIIVTTTGEISHAMEALKAGAHDYIEWPIVDRVLIESLEQATSITHIPKNTSGLEDL